VRVRPIEYDDFALQRRWGSLYQASTEDQRPELIEAFRTFANWPDAAAREMLPKVRSSPLLHLADEMVRRHGRPHADQVFVHGDVWCGNLMWTGDSCVGLIDWKTAGVGDPGVDIGNLRLQVTLRHSPDAATWALRGWEQEMRRKATHIAYWDAVAALNTQTYLDQLDGIGATGRRDAFLRAALANLGP
jgi:aminoglycoside phosphotransferase (APT) family kinase protein